MGARGLQLLQPPAELFDRHEASGRQFLVGGAHAVGLSQPLQPRLRRAVRVATTPVALPIYHLIQAGAQLLRVGKQRRYEAPYGGLDAFGAVGLAVEARGEVPLPSACAGVVDVAFSVLLARN